MSSSKENEDKSIKRDMRRIFSELLESDTASKGEDDALTYGKVIEAIDIVNSLKRDLYYSTSEFLKKGSLYILKESDFRPEFLACHPDDFAAIEVKLKTFRNLRPLSDWEPSQEYFESIGNRAKEYLDSLVCREHGIGET